jgi:hypothetical protein
LSTDNSLRANVSGPTLLNVEVRAALTAGRKKSRPVLIRVLVNAIEAKSLNIELKIPTKPSKAMFKGDEIPEDAVPSAPFRFSVPVEAGTAALEFKLAGREKSVLLALTATDGVANSDVGSTVTAGKPAGSAAATKTTGTAAKASSKTKSSGANKSSPAEKAPVVNITPVMVAPVESPTATSPNSPIATAMPAATAPALTPVAPNGVRFFGNPNEATIEESGQARVYRQVTFSQSLRAEVEGPGSLRIGVRLPAGANEPAKVVLKVSLDGMRAGTFPIELKPKASDPGTRFAAGGAANVAPGAEESFTVPLGSGAAFCEVTVEANPQVAWVFLSVVTE